MDLEDENDIQLDQAETEVPKDPLMLFQQLDSSDVKSATADALPAPPSPSPGPKPATAEVHPAQLHEAEFAKFQAYLQEHVLHWTTEPEFVEWCDPENRKSRWKGALKERSNWATASRTRSDQIIAEPTYNG